MIMPRMLSRLIAATFVVIASPLWADVKMPALFGDHMVLQQDVALPIWGTADPGEKVTVSVGNENDSAVADANGKWLIKLKPLPAGTTPLTLTVSGKNTLNFVDVLAGDVWVCSGQSNMEFGLGNEYDAKDQIPKANVPLLRLFLVPKKIALAPQEEIGTDPAHALAGHWEVCTPENIIQVGGWTGFSAVGYFFGRELQSHLNRPIGLIGTYWGGTPAQAWTSIEGLRKEPLLKHYADDYDKIHADYTPQNLADFQTKQAAYQADKAKWDQTVGKDYQVTLQAWNDAVAKAVAAGQQPPPKPQPSSPAPRGPTPPDGGSHAPSNLYNAMIAPLIPYAIKGVIWYQGESNAGQAVEYRTLFGEMITDWREKWGEGNFPFLFVQLARYQAPSPSYAELRNSQLKTLELPNTGMATAFDVGDQNDIHPKDKIDVGKRLALVARHVAYGEDLVYSGPIFDKIEVTGDKVRVNFSNIGGGLIIGSAPWVPVGAKPLSTASLVGFTISGADNKWVPADAKIDGNSVVVSSSQVPQPVAVRYAFESAVGNLYNKEGLPAIPFRSDKGAEEAPATPPAAPAPSTPPAPK